MFTWECLDLTNSKDNKEEEHLILCFMVDPILGYSLDNSKRLDKFQWLSLYCKNINEILFQFFSWWKPI